MDWWTVVLLTLPTFILLLNTYHKFNYVVKFVYLYVSYIVSVIDIEWSNMPRPAATSQPPRKWPPGIQNSTTGELADLPEVQYRG